jgi:hypothetical protein
MSKRISDLPALSGSPDMDADPIPLVNAGTTKRATPDQLRGFVGAPTTDGDTGQTGQFSVDANFFYVCSAVNAWKKVPILNVSGPGQWQTVAIIAETGDANDSGNLNGSGAAGTYRWSYYLYRAAGGTGTCYTNLNLTSIIGENDQTPQSDAINLATSHSFAQGVQVVATDGSNQIQWQVVTTGFADGAEWGLVGILEKMIAP